MSDKPLTKKVVDQWHGQISHSSPHLLPPGAMQSQINAACITPGVLEVRLGHAPITFGNATTAVSGSTGTVVSQIFFRCPHANYIVYQLADGSLVGGQNPD